MPGRPWKRPRIRKAACRLGSSDRSILAVTLFIMMLVAFGCGERNDVVAPVQTVNASRGGDPADSPKRRVTAEFASVEAGLYHTCALTWYQRAYCWGGNFSGELGNGTSGPYAERTTPDAVAGGHHFTQISAGASHTCGLTRSGLAYCWGDNLSGHLGDGTTTDRNIPTPVATTQQFVTIQAGAYHTCALDVKQRAWCWGFGEHGQLGDGANQMRTKPVAVAGNFSFVRITAGTFHTCALDLTGRAWCWGRNDFGAFGNGTTASSNVPVAAGGSGIFLHFAGLAAGHLHTCGVTTKGRAYCWGHNGNGQLGDGTNSPSHIPVLVSGSHSFAAIDANGTSTSTCGITTTNQALCWGENDDGQLGDGTTIDRNVPTAVAGGFNFIAITAGVRHSCAIRDLPAANPGWTYCWGDNLYGALGNSSYTPSLVPVAVVW